MEMRSEGVRNLPLDIPRPGEKSVTDVVWRRMKVKGRTTNVLQRISPPVFEKQCLKETLKRLSSHFNFLHSLSLSPLAIPPLVGLRLSNSPFVRSMNVRVVTWEPSFNTPPLPLLPIHGPSLKPSAERGEWHPNAIYTSAPSQSERAFEKLFLLFSTLLAPPRVTIKYPFASPPSLLLT